MKNILLLITVVLISNFCLSQEIGDYLNFDQYIQDELSSPEVKSFEKVSLIPNDLSTGKLNLTIPIYNLQIGRLKYPIGLSYNSGGIKVDQQSSEVGLGWNISKTIITRQTIDGNDFDNVGTQYYDAEGGGFADNINDPEFNAHFYTTQKKMGYLLKEKLNFKATSSTTTVDEMPDIYTLLSSDGFQTKFYLKDYNTPIELTEKSSIIEFIKGKQVYNNPQYISTESKPYFPMYDLLKIEITSQDGIKYTFQDFDVVISNSYEINVFNNTNSIDGIYRVPEISAWHISKIEDLLTGEEINFEYDTYNADPVTGSFLTFSDTDLPPDGLIVNKSIKTIPQGGWLNNTFTNCPNRVFRADFSYNSRKQLYLRTHYSRHYVKNRLVKITFNGGKIDFNWNNNRQDLYNSKSLDNIKVYGYNPSSSLNNNLIKEFNFQYEYFDSANNCQNAYRCKRLKLTSVEEVGKPAYQFTYYNENGNFPQITSNKKDFMGYYNSAISHPDNAHVVPNLYYYPFKNEKSILPFNIPGITEKYPIYGDYDATASSISDVQTWSLETITYPTGASSKIEYELNDVELFGKDVITSGLRVKSQIITDNSILARKIDYQYRADNNSLSSGSFVNFPYYGRPSIVIGQNFEDLSKWDERFIHDTFIIDQHPRLDSDLSKNAYVLYKQVIEKEQSNGYTNYEFLSNDRYPNDYNRGIISPNSPELNRFTGGIMCGDFFVMRNSGFGTQYYTDNSFKRGKLISKTVFDNNDEILQETINQYFENNSPSSENYTKRLFHANRRILDNPLNRDFENIFDVTKEYTTNTFKLRNTIKIDHFNNDLNRRIKFDYNSIGLVSKKTEYLYNEGQNNTLIEDFYYVDETSSQLTGISLLKSLNYLSKIVKVEEKTTDSNVEIYTKGAEFLFNSDGHVEKVLSIDKELVNLEEISFDYYTNNGKTIQYKNNAGITTVILWGYNYQYPIAKIQGATYAQVLTALNRSSTDNLSYLQEYTPEQLKTELQKLRNHNTMSNTMIHTYTYDPLIGITSITDAKGYTMYYEYDDSNRLVIVKDDKKRVLSKNDYNYHSQN